jgi:hypothetical protein
MQSTEWPARTLAEPKHWASMLLPTPTGSTTDCTCFDVLTRRPSSDASCPAAKLLARALGIANRVNWTLLDEQLDAGRELLADVEAARPLTVVPIEAIPIRPVAGSSRRALLTGGFATPHVLLAVDDTIRAPSPTPEIGAARLSQRPAQSLHKTLSSEGNLLGGLG